MKIYFRSFKLSILHFSLDIPSEEHTPKTDQDEENGEKSIRKRNYRLEALHVRGGFGKSGLKSPSAEDYYDYFKDFNPVSFEWVDAESANVVWALPNSSAKAMLSLSRPLLRKEEEAMEVNQRAAEVEGDEEMVDEEQEKKSQKTKISKEELIRKVI